MNGLARWIQLAVVLSCMVPAVARADGTFVLAVSWQPAFCETRPEKPECTSQTDDRFDASHFSLHGLWPQPRGNAYCGVESGLRAIDEAGKWSALPAPRLAEATRTELDRAMPGARSGLDRHEWIKHGTCYGTGEEAYFADSLRLLAELNASPIRDLFAERVGKVVSARDIRIAFDRTFGSGAGRRVEVDCRRVGARRLIVELKISLAGPINAALGLSDLMQRAPVAPDGCVAGIVDRVGIGLADP